MNEVAPTQPDDASEGRASLVGTLIGGRYRIEAMLGTGGMGSVFRAEHVHMKKTLAVKVLHRELLAIGEVVARFEREAIAAARIEHPNVAKATDFGCLEDGSFYLVMEFVSGRSLGALVGEGPIAPARAVGIAVQIAAAVDAAHQAGIVHRDLKPDNVLLVETAGEQLDSVKVLDFGIAKLDATASGGSSKLTRAGTVFGTPEYMAPEQAAGSAVDQRADLYALGVMLYEMLTGKTPFDDADVVTLLTRQLTEPPPLPAGLPRGLSDLVMQLLAKDPGERPSSAREVMDRLLAIEKQLSVVPRAASGLPFAATELALEMPPAPAPGSGKKLVVIGAIATVLGLVLTLVLFAATRDKPVPPPLLASGAFDVVVPKPRPAPAPRVTPKPAARAAASSTAEPAKSAPRKSGGKSKAPAKKKTGPGGIYIPPPSQWF